MHDLGNPPFGHAGEDAIKMWFETKDEEFWNSFGIVGDNSKLRNDFIYFDGNAQTLRLVSCLQVMADLNGLNLTSSTFASLVKYEADCNGIDQDKHLFSKLGYFQTESELVEKVRLETSSMGKRHPITYLIEAADDIVYGIIDVEDAMKKGVVSWKMVVESLNKAAEADDLSPIQRDNLCNLHTKAESFITNRLKDIKSKHISLEEGYIQYYRTLVIGEAVKSVRKVFIQNYESIMNGTYSSELLKDSEMYGVYRCLKKEIGRKLIYRCKEAIELEVLGLSLIHI